MKTKWSMLIAVLVATLSAGRSMATLCTSTATGGNWDNASTWVGGSIPGNNDVATIVPGATVTCVADVTCATLNFENTGSNTATVVVNPGVNLKVRGTLTCKNSATGNTSVVLQGGGSMWCNTFVVGGTTTPTPANSDYFATVTCSIADVTIAGNIRIKALYNATVSAANQGELRIPSGSIVCSGTVEFTTVPFFGPILTLATGAQNGTLNVSGGTPFSFVGGGSYTFTPNGSNATVVYSGAAQTVLAATYQNLFLDGSSTKTTTGVTVNVMLSRRGAATVSALPTYGAAATLEYKGSSAQTSGAELAANLPNLTIDNTNGVTLAAGTTVNGSFSLVNGKLITGANQLNLNATALASAGSASSYVNGNLQKTFNVGTTSFTFPIGDASSFAPVTFSNLTVTASGSVKVTTTAGNHPQIIGSGVDSNKAVNRYWTLTQTGGTFGNATTTFGYPGTDVDVGSVPADFTVQRYSGGSWTSAYVSSVPTTNSTTITGPTGFGDFVIGDLPPVAQTVSGSYVGNGVDNRSIAVPFQPDVVIVKSLSGTVINGAVIRSSTMPGEGTKGMTDGKALQTNQIQSFDAAGFIVGTDTNVNANGVTYHWVAFKACDGRMKVGSYAGNGANGHAITGVGFSPSMVMFVSASTQNLVFHSTASSLSFQLNSDAGSSMVNSLDTNGFTLATDSRVNGNGVTYHYIAWAAVPGQNNGSTYTGNGADNRSITNAGFLPEYVMIKPFAATAAVHHPHSVGDATDQSLFFTASSDVANRIQALQSTGFQVGTGSEVNQSGVTYFAMSWKRTIAPSKLAITSVNGGAPVTAGTPFSVVVQAQDALGNAGNVRLSTTVTLSVNTGGGTVGGTLTGTIPAGAGSVTITGTTYTKAEGGVVLTATRTTGDILAAGNSNPFLVNAGAFSKLQVILPGESPAPGTASGKTGSPFAQEVAAQFNVIVNSVDANWNPISTNDMVSISSSDASAALPANGALSGGSTIFIFTAFSNAGPQTITASDVTHPAIGSGTAGLNVQKGTQSIAFPYPGDQTYNGQTIDPGATASSGLQVNYAVLSGPGIISSNQLKLTGAGTILLEVTQPGNSNWNPAIPVSGFAILVLPKTLSPSVTVSNKVYDGFVFAPVANATLSGIVGNDDVSLTGIVATFADKNVGANKPVTAGGLTLSGTNAASYVLSSDLVMTTGTITPAPLVVTAAAGNKTYDGLTNATVTFLDDRIGDDLFSINYASSAFADKNVGASKPVLVSGISLSGPDAGNYVANSNATTTATILAALLTVTANDTNRPYGATNPEFTARYEGFVNGEGAEVLSGNPALSTTADALSSVGSYAITATNGTLASANYTFEFVDGTLTITLPRAALTIEFMTDAGSGTNYVIVRAQGLVPSSQVKLEASTDLKQWAEIATLQAESDGSITHMDLDVAQNANRFYRVVSQ
jgi:hypothetical protein